MDFYEKTLDIGMRYLDNTISTEELTTSTITVTDLSGFGVLHCHPIINGRQSTIIGLGGDGTQPNFPMSISMTVDHRVADGREVATFLKELRERILSYAPAAEEAESQPQAASPFPSGASTDIRCDRCEIDLASYYRRFARDARMMPYFREDGSIGGICHRCAMGAI